MSRVLAGGAGGGSGEAEAPDLGACLLQQKLQMLALCIARRSSQCRGGQTTPTTTTGLSLAQLGASGLPTHLSWL